LEAGVVDVEVVFAAEVAGFAEGDEVGGAVVFLVAVEVVDVEGGDFRAATAASGAAVAVFVAAFPEDVSACGAWVSHR
jgi:energy-converting hydrogenase Eha subunit G